MHFLFRELQAIVKPIVNNYFLIMLSLKNNLYFKNTFGDDQNSLV